MKLRHLLTATAIAILLAGLSAPVLAGRGNSPKDADDAAALDDFGPGPEGHGHGRGPGGPGGPEGPEGLGGPGGPEGMRRAMMPFWEHEEITAKMNLTEEQTKALEESHAIAKEVVDANKDAVKEAGEALRAEMEKDTPDAATAKALSAKFAEKREIVGQAVLEHVVHVKSILSADQEKQLRQGGRKFGREKMEELGELRGEIREILQSGGTIEDVKALLEEKDLPPHVQEMIVKRVEDRMAEKE